MGVWAKMLLNDFAFIANTQDLNIPADKVKYLDIMPRVGQSGGSAVSIADIKGMVSNIIVKLGGIRICNMSYTDLIALNSLWLQRTPLLVMVGAGDDQAGFVGPSRLPLFVLKLGRELSAQFEFANPANAWDETLDVKYTYKDTDFPEFENLHFAYETFAEVGVASGRTNISRIGAKLVGILIFNTHDGMNAAIPTEPEVSELDLIVDDRVVYSDIWTCRGDEKANVNHMDDAVMGTQEDNYQWISFQEEPWSADNLWLIRRNTVHWPLGIAQTGICRFICVYAEP
jgi:hypothetical protein